MKNTPKGFAFLPIILIIAAVLAVGGGAYYYTENEDASQEVEVKTETNADVQTNATVKNDTSLPVQKNPAASNTKVDWKTYTNAKLGFSIAYPGDWMDIQIDQNQLLRLVNKSTYNTIKTNEEEDVGKGFYFWDDLSVKHYNDFSVFLREVKSWDSSNSNITARNLDELILSKRTSGFLRVTEKITVDGKQGYYGIWDAGISSGPVVLLEHNGGVYVIALTDNKEIRDRIISTIKFASKTTDPIEATPVIDSITPNRGPVGTTIEVRGKNLAGFESDLDLWFVNSNGIQGLLQSEDRTSSTYIRVKIPSRLCQINTSYSGLPCSAYLEMMPGVYKVYALPLGEKSNMVEFTVTAN